VGVVGFPAVDLAEAGEARFRDLARSSYYFSTIDLPSHKQITFASFFEFDFLYVDSGSHEATVQIYDKNSVGDCLRDRHALDFRERRHLSRHAAATGAVRARYVEDTRPCSISRSSL
jgi:hypothetical protein